MLYDSAYIGDNDPHNPYISPIYGEFIGFPPMLMQVGTHEVLLSDTLTVAEKAKKKRLKLNCLFMKVCFMYFRCQEI